MNNKLRTLVKSYAETLDEGRGDVPLGRLFSDLDDFPELEQDSDLTFIIGWLTGAAEVLELLPEQLIARCRQ